MALGVVIDQLADGMPAVKAVLALVFPLLLFILLRHFSARGCLLPLRHAGGESSSGAGLPSPTFHSAAPLQCKRMPPSPPAMPLIGHLHHLIASGLPHVSLRDLAARQQQGQDDGGLMLLRLGMVPTLVVSSPHAAQQVLRTHDASFASRPGSVVGDILSYGPSDVGFAPYGEWWRQAKKLVTTHLLTAKKVQSYRAAREEEVGAAIARIRGAAAAHAPVDMSELLSSFTNDVLCRAVAGRSFRVEGRNKVFHELIEAGTAVVGGFNLENFYPRLAKVAGGVLTWPARQRAERLRRRWDDIFDALIDEHAGEMAPGADGGADMQDSDFIHVLLSVQEEYGLTRNRIKGILADMFTAGTDTGYLVLEFAMVELMLHQDALAKLQAEMRKTISDGQETMISEGNLAGMTYLKAVIKETLRLHPPSPLLVPHLSLEDCDVDNYMVPAGTSVFINAWAIGRDPRMWNAPEEFMPERFIDSKGDITGADFGGNDFQFLPFGSGRRICPGVNFAMASVEIMLSNLVYHFDWELPEGVHSIDMTEVFGLTVRRKEKLLLTPRFHHPRAHEE